MMIKIILIIATIKSKIIMNTDNNNNNNNCINATQQRSNIRIEKKNKRIGNCIIEGH